MTALVTLLSLWLALLGVVALALLREVELVASRLRSTGVFALDGPEIGSVIPHFDAFSLSNDATYVFLSVGCPPCMTVAESLEGFSHGEHRIEVVIDDGGAGGPIDSRIPETMERHTGELAEALRDAFRISRTPIAVQVEHGLVVGKGVLRHANDLARLVSA